MGYRGRVGFFLLTMLYSGYYPFFYYRTYGEIKPFELIGDVSSLILAWFVGKQFDKVKYMSERDNLTGIYNRRYVTTHFQKIVKKASHKSQKISLLLVDVNDFKGINDSYGHEDGDKAIQYIGKILSQSIRSGDIVARWGGDEFLLIANVGISGANSIVNRIKESLQHSHLSSYDREITVSIGTAVYPDDAQTLDDLVRIADQNMFLDKNTVIRKLDNL